MPTSGTSFAPWHLGIVAVMAASLGCGVPSVDRGNWSEEDQLFEIGPYVVPAGNGRVFISVKTASTPELEYWVEGTEDRGVGSPRPPDAVILSGKMSPVDDLYVASIEGLPSGRQIGYQLRTEKGSTPVYRFRVGRNPGEPFRFAAFGDTRTGHNVHRAVVERMAEEHIDFVLNTGDLVDRGGVKSQWENFFQIERPLLVDTPVMPAIGNHDWSGRQYFRRYFMLSRWRDDRRYYLQDWGNLRILVVDAGIECREGCAQYAFAEQALAEGDREGKFMIIALHFPPYSSGAHGSNKTVQKAISDLAERHGAELVVTGHDHNYERTKPIDGVTYVVSGSAGAPIRPVSRRRFTAHARTEPHYVLFDVSADHMTMRAVNLQGDVFDTATFGRLAPEQ